ncbi:hypothetical protein [Taklimakanibacter lacteus]|uniref:hypothetical protein n=1 Tax=Taklimakanibacter lacteus TaxID=2268456 RepID=UPI000E6645C8
MCSACGFPATEGHWSEAGAADAHQRLRARFIRARKLNEVLRNYGLSAYDDGQTPGIQIADRTGQVILARDLGEVWIAAEKLVGKAIDPLDPRFMAR